MNNSNWIRTHLAVLFGLFLAALIAFMQDTTIYAEDTIPTSTMTPKVQSKIDTKLGWKCKSDYLIRDSGTYLGHLDQHYIRDFYKKYDGYAIAVFGEHSDSWVGPILISTDPEYIVYRVKNASGDVENDNVDGGGEYEYLGLKWYVNTGWHVRNTTFTSPLVKTNSSLSIKDILDLAGVEVDRTDLSSASLTFPSGLLYVYNGSEQKPDVTVTLNGKTLTKDTDYTISYSNNTKGGTAKVTITGKGLYKGTVSKNFYILPDFNLTYREDTYRNINLVFTDTPSGIDSIEVYYYKNGNTNTNKVKTFLLSSVSNKTVTLTKLSNGSSYTVKARAIKGTEKSDWIEKTISIPAKLLVSDFWGFGNHKASNMAPYYEKFMGQAKAQEFNDSASGGICYGMVTGALASIVLDYPFVSSWNSCNVLQDIETTSTNSSELGISVEDFIRYAFVMQDLPGTKDGSRRSLDTGVIEIIGGQRGFNFGDLLGLYNAVKNASNTGKAVSIKLIGHGLVFKGNHQIAGLKIANEDNEKAEILVYDPNNPKRTDMRLVLYKESGTFTSWKYGDGDGSVFSGKNGIGQNGLSWYNFKENDLITYEVDVENFFKQEYEKLKNYSNYTEYYLNVLHFDDVLDASILSTLNQLVDDATYQYILPSNGTSSNKDFKFWTKSKNLTLKAVPAGTTLTMASDYHSTKVTVSSASDVTIKASDTKEMSVSVKPKTNAKITVAINDYSNTSNAVETKTVTLTGKKGTTATVTQSTNAELKVKGATAVSVKKQTGTKSSDGTIAYSSSSTVSKKNMTATDVYNIATSGSKLTVKESSTTVKKGTKKTVGKLKYKVTAVSGKTGKAAVIGPKSKTSTTVSIPATIKISGTTLKVTAVGKNAFKKMKKLKKVTIGKNVTAIGANAFYGCTALSKVTLGPNVTTIGSGAFYSCKKLSSIVLPAKVTKIGKNAFRYDTALKKITIRTSKLKLKNVGAKAFSGINAKAVIKVPKKKLKSYKTLLKKRGVGKKVKIA